MTEKEEIVVTPLQTIKDFYRWCVRDVLRGKKTKRFEMEDKTVVTITSFANNLDERMLAGRGFLSCVGNQPLYISIDKPGVDTLDHTAILLCSSGWIRATPKETYSEGGKSSLDTDLSNFSRYTPTHHTETLLEIQEEISQRLLTTPKE